MKDIFNKIFRNKKTIFSVVLFCVVFVLLSVEPTLAAGVGDAVATVLGWIAALITTLIGYILLFFIKIVVNVAQFNKIVDVPAVASGWFAVREIVNMFFVLVLLFIAFATILRLESYSAKRLLPKLLIMAVLVNFSKTIFAWIVDASQLLMLFFVSRFGTYGANNLANIFQIQKMGTIASESQLASDVTGWSTSVGIIAGVFAMIVTLIVVIVMLAVLVMRVIMLWVYTILSPLVFLGFAFPPLQKYIGRIWEDFIKQVMVGPLLAFFLWLALTTAEASSNKLGNFANDSSGQLCAGLNDLFCEGNFQTYIITIGLLIGGLMVTQQIGGAAGSIAGKGMAWAKGAHKIPLGIGGWGARKIKAGAIAKVPGLKWTKGLELRPTKIIEGVKEGLKAQVESDETKGLEQSAEALRKGGVGGLIKGLGASRDLTEALAGPGGVMWNKGIMNVYKRVLAPKKSRKEPIQTYYADQKRNAAVREEMGKLGDNDNEDDLHSKLMSAINNDDTEAAAAIYQHMYKVGHGNEALENTKALEDVKDEKGNTVIKKDDYFTADAHGIKGFVDQYLVGKLGMTKNYAYSTQSTASTLAKQANHFALAEAVGVENGELILRDAKTQQARAHGELMKADAETVLRRMNRLAHGKEKQFYNKETGKDDRVLIPNDLTMQNFIKLAPSWDKEINKQKRFNPNYAENIYKNYKLREEENENVDYAWQDIMKAVGDKTFIDTDGNSKQYKQLVLESARYGHEKTEAKNLQELATAKASGDEDIIKKIEAEIEKDAIVRTKIDEELKKFPGGSGGSKKKTKEDVLDEQAKMI